MANLTMNGEKRLLLTNEPIEFERNRWLKFKTSWKSTIILEEFIEYTCISWRKTKRCQHVTDWTWKHWGYWPIMLKNLPGHCSLIHGDVSCIEPQTCICVVFLIPASSSFSVAVCYCQVAQLQPRGLITSNGLYKIWYLVFDTLNANAYTKYQAPYEM